MDQNNVSKISTFISHALVFGRGMMVSIGVISVLVHYLSNHQWREAYEYLHQAQPVAAGMFLIGVAGAIWSQVKLQDRKYLEQKLQVISAVLDGIAGSGAAKAIVAGGPVPQGRQLDPLPDPTAAKTEPTGPSSSDQ